jgi:hypothetical protein
VVEAATRASAAKNLNCILGIKFDDSATLFPQNQYLELKGNSCGIRVGDRFICNLWASILSRNGLQSVRPRAVPQPCLSDLYPS